MIRDRSGVGIKNKIFTGIEGGAPVSEVLDVTKSSTFSNYFTDNSKVLGYKYGNIVIVDFDISVKPGVTLQGANHTIASSLPKPIGEVTAPAIVENSDSTIPYRNGCTITMGINGDCMLVWHTGSVVASANSRIIGQIIYLTE